MRIKRIDEENKILNALMTSNIVFITGNHGVGKTYLAMNLASKNDWNYMYFNLSSAKLDNTILVNRHPTTIYIFDDVDTTITDFINNDYVRKLMNLEHKIIVIMSESKGIKKYPSVSINPLSNEEMHGFLSQYNDISDDDIQMIINVSKGMPFIFLSLVDMIQAGDISSDKAIGLLSNEVFLYEILAKHVLNSKSIEKTTDESREILFQIIKFGPLDISKLERWNSTINVSESLTNLQNNKYITAVGSKVIYTFRNIRFSDIEEKKYTDNMISILTVESTNGYDCREEYFKLINVLKVSDPRIDFVASFYENNYLAEEKQRLKDLEETLKNVLECVNRTQSNTEEIKLTQREQLNYFVGEIEKIRQKSSNNEDILNQLNELESILKNPEKSKYNRLNEIIGTIGSIASIAGIMGVSNLGSQIRNFVLSTFL